MKNVKLRLDYFLSLGLKLVEGDGSFRKSNNYKGFFGNRLWINELNNRTNNDVYDMLITSFAPRKNTGDQPCGDNVPVVIRYLDDTETRIAGMCTWQIDCQLSDITCWKPDIDELINMQIEHDRKLALTAELEKVATAALKQGDKRRIEFMSNHTGQLEVHAVTYQFETDKEICCIAEDGLILLVDKEEFVAWHDAVDELEAAKKKQIDDYFIQLNENGEAFSKYKLEVMQELGMLAEIILPLKN